jgi:hypothetical protein
VAILKRMFGLTIRWEVGSVIATVIAFAIAGGSIDRADLVFRVTCFIAALLLGVILGLSGAIPKFRPARWVRILFAVAWIAFNVSILRGLLSPAEGAQPVMTLSFSVTSDYPPDCSKAIKGFMCLPADLNKNHDFYERYHMYPGWPIKSLPGVLRMTVQNNGPLAWTAYGLKMRFTYVMSPNERDAPVYEDVPLASIRGLSAGPGKEFFEITRDEPIAPQQSVAVSFRNVSCGFVEVTPEMAVVVQSGSDQPIEVQPILAGDEPHLNNSVLLSPNRIPGLPFCGDHVDK